MLSFGHRLNILARMVDTHLFLAWVPSCLSISMGFSYDNAKIKEILPTMKNLMKNYSCTASF